MMNPMDLVVIPTTTGAADWDLGLLIAGFGGLAMIGAITLWILRKLGEIF